MGPAIGAILSMAVGVALSPLPIVAVILMLLGPKARVNGVAFLAGWVAGLLVVGGIVLISGFGDGGTSSDSTSTAKVVLGALLLVLAARNWRQRPKAGETPELPAWMAAIDDFGPPKAAGVAALLSGVNPKNLALTLAAAATITGAGLSSSQEWGVLVVFVLLASVTVAVPVVGYLAAGEKAESWLGELRGWLVANNHTVMAVVLLVLGAKVLGDGLAIFG